MQRVTMKQGEIDLFRVSLLGIAAVGGMMAGTCGRNDWSRGAG